MKKRGLGGGGGEDKEEEDPSNGEVGEGRRKFKKGNPGGEKREKARKRQNGFPKKKRVPQKRGINQKGEPSRGSLRKMVCASGIGWTEGGFRIWIYIPLGLDKTLKKSHPKPCRNHQVPVTTPEVTPLLHEMVVSENGGIPLEGENYKTKKLTQDPTDKVRRFSIK